MPNTSTAGLSDIISVAYRLADGRILEHDAIVCSRAEWSRRRESKDPAWTATPVGPKGRTILAGRLVEMAVAVDP